MRDLVCGVCAPEEVGFSSSKVEACLRALDETENEIHGIVMERHGKVFCESYLAPYGKGMPHTNHSLGKSYTCTGFGIACREGILSPDDLLTDVFAEEIRRYGIEPDEKMARLRMRHLLSMTVGMAFMPRMDERWLENFLRAKIEYEPGTRFLYNSVASCMLGAAVEKRSGEDLADYMQKRLFDRIGIPENEFVWRRFTGGYSAEPGTASSTRANLRLGMFYAAKGFADGEQIVARPWMEEAMTKQIETGNHANDGDSSMGYGWQLWMCKTPGIVRFDGGQGQFAIIWPERDMVIAIHEAGVNPTGVQKVLDLVEALMADAADTAMPADAAGVSSLRAYEAGRRVADAEVLPVPDCTSDWMGEYVVVDGAFRPWIEVAPMKEDFYHLFYSQSRSMDVRTIRLKIDGNALLLTADGDTVIRASLTGKWQADKAVTVMEDLPDYAATARFPDKDTLRVSVRWLNGWCCPEMTFTRGENGMLDILVQKDMLAAGRAPHERRAVAVRIR